MPNRQQPHLSAELKVLASSAGSGSAGFEFQEVLLPPAGKRGRKRLIRHDKRRYRERWRIEATEL